MLQLGLNRESKVQELFQQNLIDLWLERNQIIPIADTENDYYYAICMQMYG